MNVLIVEDEMMAQANLARALTQHFPDVRIVGTTGSVRETVLWLRTPGNSADVIFMDVELSDGDCFEIFRQADVTARVIMTTAYDNYAVRAFEVNSIDYLLKPIDYNEFLRAAHKALKWFSLTREKTEPAPSAPAHTYLLVRSDYRQVRIDTSDILYIEALKDYVKIFLASSAQPVITQSSLKSLEERLPAGQFMRIHRSYIVRLDAVKIIERSRVVFGKTYLPISDTCRDDFLRALEGRSIPQ